jgi:hypothetical protein
MAELYGEGLVNLVGPSSGKVKRGVVAELESFIATRDATPRTGNEGEN